MGLVVSWLHTLYVHQLFCSERTDKHKIDPKAHGWGPYDVNLYNLSDEEKARLQSLPASLEAALDALEADHHYLTAGGVFPQELISNFIKLKRAECRRMAAIPHPAEFESYFNL